MPAPNLIDVVQIGVEAAAVIAFAMSGLLAAARKRLDVVGVFVVAGLAAFGGGTLRDILLDRRPFFWVEQSAWLWVLLALCSGAMLFMHARHLEPTERAMQWPDALGLGLFTAVGTQLALAHGMPMLVAVLLGVVTATFGGVLRDVVCNEIPGLFRDHRPYAVCAFVGGWTAVAAQALGASDLTGLLLASTTTTVLRLASLWLDLSLPSWQQVAGQDPRPSVPAATSGTSTPRSRPRSSRRRPRSWSRSASRRR